MFEGESNKYILTETLIWNVFVEALVVRIGNMVKVECFSSMDRSLRNYVLRFAHNIKSKVKQNLKLRTVYFTSKEFDNIEKL